MEPLPRRSMFAKVPSSHGADTVTSSREKRDVLQKSAVSVEASRDAPVTPSRPARDAVTPSVTKTVRNVTESVTKGSRAVTPVTEPPPPVTRLLALLVEVRGILRGEERGDRSAREEALRVIEAGLGRPHRGPAKTPAERARAYRIRKQTPR